MTKRNLPTDNGASKGAADEVGGPAAGAALSDEARASALCMAFGFDPRNPVGPDRSLPWAERQARCEARKPHTTRALQLAWRALELGRAIYETDPGQPGWRPLVEELERAYVAVGGLGSDVGVVRRVRIFAALDGVGSTLYNRCLAFRAAARRHQKLSLTREEKKRLKVDDTDVQEGSRWAVDSKWGPKHAQFKPAEAAAEALIARLQAVLPEQADKLEELHSGAAKAIDAWMVRKPGRSQWEALNANLLKPLGLAVGNPDSLKVEWSNWQSNAREHPLLSDRERTEG